MNGGCFCDRVLRKNDSHHLTKGPRVAENMLKFIDTEQAYPEKRPPDLRKEDFEEIYREYILKKAAEQSSRCSQCGVPFCQTGCPLENNIPDWLRLAAEGRLREAYEVSAETNPAPEICGRICPQDRLCEGSCVIERSGHGAVTIGSVEKFLTDTAWREGWVRPIAPKFEREQTVGVIGSGPAALACAEKMRIAGYGVTVYERADRAGGLLTYGIPGFKLEKDTVMRRIRRLEASGVEFKLECEIGRDITFKALREKHDAIYIAIGVYKARRLKMPGAREDSIISATHFLVASNRKGFKDAVPDYESGHLNAAGKRVVVVGGGDTAMDCVRTAVRQGALSVTCLYRRDRDNMPGSSKETRHAEEEGVKFEWLSAPKALTHNADGSIKSLAAVKMRLAAPDMSGRRAPEAVADSEYFIEADMVIEALGYDPEDAPALFDAPELKISEYGTIITDETGETALPGVFAGGDIVRGASLAVWALRDGRDVAPHMRAYLRRQAESLMKEITE